MPVLPPNNGEHLTCLIVCLSILALWLKLLAPSSQRELIANHQRDFTQFSSENNLASLATPAPIKAKSPAVSRPNLSNLNPKNITAIENDGCLASDVATLLEINEANILKINQEISEYRRQLLAIKKSAISFVRDSPDGAEYNMEDYSTEANKLIDDLTERLAGLVGSEKAEFIIASATQTKDGIIKKVEPGTQELAISMLPHDMIRVKRNAVRPDGTCRWRGEQISRNLPPDLIGVFEVRQNN